MAIQSEKNGIFNEINITPLTDIFLVLLIIMMVVAPTFQSVDSSINIPEINSGVSIEQKDAIVAITSDGTFYLNNNKISADSLYSELEAIKDNLDKKEVVVKADATVKSSLIMEVMRAAEAAKYEKLTIAGEPLSKKESKLIEETSEEIDNSNQYSNKEENYSNTNKKAIGAIPGD